VEDAVTRRAPLHRPRPTWADERPRRDRDSEDLSSGRRRLPVREDDEPDDDRTEIDPWTEALR
jgi:hypothetical protein